MGVSPGGRGSVGSQPGSHAGAARGRAGLQKGVFEQLGPVGRWQEPSAATALPKPHAPVRVLFLGTVLAGLTCYLLSTTGSVTAAVRERAEAWVRWGAGRGPLQPSAYAASSLGLGVEGPAARLPSVSSDAETFLPGGARGASGFSPGFCSVILAKPLFPRVPSSRRERGIPPCSGQNLPPDGKG